jgi:hypothetical protein
VGENIGDRRLHPRGIEEFGTSVGTGVRLGTESSIPAFSRSGGAPGRERCGYSWALARMLPISEAKATPKSIPEASN